MDDPDRTTYWAGPALVTSPDQDATVAVLVLWRRSPAGVDSPSHTSAELLDRGFSRLPGPGLEQLRALPHLADVRIRLSAGGRLLVDDGPSTLFEGAGNRASDQWHATARSGGLTLLVDVDPGPDGDALDDDEPDAQVLARFTTACRAGALFGARVDVTRLAEPATAVAPPERAEAP